MRVYGLLLCVVLGCGSASPPERTTAAPQLDTARQPERVEAASCLTLRDAELGCARRCGSLMMALRTCAFVGVRGRIIVRWQREADSRVHYRIDAQGAQLDRVTPCVERTFARFEPCNDGEAEGTVPLVFTP